jgi:hypothetical protein
VKEIEMELFSFGTINGYQIIGLLQHRENQNSYTVLAVERGTDEHPDTTYAVATIEVTGDVLPGHWYSGTYFDTSRYGDDTLMIAQVEFANQSGAMDSLWTPDP